MQSLKFDRMDFSNFYSDLIAGTTIPYDSELAERVKEQLASALQLSSGKGRLYETCLFRACYLDESA
ncbi:hypothetical protein ACNIRU_26620, partial [Escherichia coli]